MVGMGLMAASLGARVSFSRSEVVAGLTRGGMQSTRAGSTTDESALISGRGLSE